MTHIKKRNEFRNGRSVSINEKADLTYNTNIDRYMRMRQQLSAELMNDIDTICRANNGLMRIGNATDRDYANVVYIANVEDADEKVTHVFVNRFGDIEVETNRNTYKLTDIDCETLLHLYDTMMICNDHPEYMEEE